MSRTDVHQKGLLIIMVPLVFASANNQPMHDHPEVVVLHRPIVMEALHVIVSKKKDGRNTMKTVLEMLEFLLISKKH